MPITTKVPKRDSYNRREAAARLGVSIRVLDRLIAEGALASIKVGGPAGGASSTRLVPQWAIDEYLAGASKVGA